MNLTTIYLVDDYLLTRIAHRNYLEGFADFRIAGDFSTARACLEGLQFFEPDIILMDIDLPDVNGIEAAKLIKEKYPKVKIIILTSIEKEEQMLLALASGACGYVLKNNPNTDLRKVIKAVEEGVFWMDLKSAKAAFSLLLSPSGNFSQNDEHKELKNILTERELEVLKLMAQGKTNSQIATEIVVSTNTAKAHVGNILSKLDVRDRVQAVVKAMRAHLF